MLRENLSVGITQVGLALRDPEEFTAGWNEGRNAYRPVVWAALLAAAITGTTTYGMTMGLLGGAGAIFHKGFICTVAAGAAWAIALPALFIFSIAFRARVCQPAARYWQR